MLFIFAFSLLRSLCVNSPMYAAYCTFTGLYMLYMILCVCVRCVAFIYSMATGQKLKRIQTHHTHRHIKTHTHTQVSTPCAGQMQCLPNTFTVTIHAFPPKHTSNLSPNKTCMCTFHKTHYCIRALSVSVWERSLGKWGMIGEWLFAVSHSCDVKIHREEELPLSCWLKLTTNRWRRKLVGGAEL